MHRHILNHLRSYSENRAVQPRRTRQDRQTDPTTDHHQHLILPCSVPSPTLVARQLSPGTWQSPRPGRRRLHLPFRWHHRPRWTAVHSHPPQTTRRQTRPSPGGPRRTSNRLRQSPPSRLRGACPEPAAEGGPGCPRYNGRGHFRRGVGRRGRRRRPPRAQRRSLPSVSLRWPRREGCNETGMACRFYRFPVELRCVPAEEGGL